MPKKEKEYTVTIINPEAIPNACVLFTKEVVRIFLPKVRNGEFK